MVLEKKLAEEKIHKPVGTLAIVPSSGSITRVARQAYTIMLLMAKEQGAENEKSGMFSAPVNSIIRGFDGSVTGSTRLKDDLKSMVSHVVEWQSPSEGENSHEWGALSLLSEVKIKKLGNEHWVHWAYPPSIRQELLDPTIFAKLQRSTIGKFRTYGGLALYEICARYQDNPGHLTSKREWKWWVPVLTGKPAPPESKKVEFRYFNRDTVQPAVEEVNEVSELAVVAKEIRVGKSIAFLQFEVRKKPLQTLKKIEAIDGSALAKAERLGIGKDAADDLWLKFGNERMLAALNRLASRLSQSTTPVVSRVAYLKSILNDKTGAFDNSPKLIDDEVESRPMVEVTAAPAGNVNYAEASMKRAQESGAQRMKSIRDEIEALTPEVRTGLIENYISYASSNAMHKRVIEKLEEGAWSSSMVFGHLAVYYWKKTRGTDWSCS